MSAREPQGQPDADANIQRLCRLGGVSRAGFYRSFDIDQPACADADMRDPIQRISLARRHYGYRRIAAQLPREGHVVNAKRVLRLMREDNLLCLRAKPFAPRTTDSRHGFSVVPNLTRGLIPTGLDQIGVADITYVRLGEAFVYLAVVLDAHSRKVMGWALDDHLEARLAIAALDMEIAAREPTPDSLIHHSDRGVQYACVAYAERLTVRGIRASMSRVANPHDNAKAESFMKTLKAEEVNAKTCATIEGARSQISAFIETVYNVERRHSALDDKPPAEFEADLARSRNPKPKSELALSPK